MLTIKLISTDISALDLTKEVLKEDNYLVKTPLTVGGKAITRNWLDTDLPRHGQWLHIVLEVFGELEKGKNG